MKKKERRRGGTGKYQGLDESSQSSEDEDEDEDDDEEEDDDELERGLAERKARNAQWSKSNANAKAPLTDKQMLHRDIDNMLDEEEIK